MHIGYLIQSQLTLDCKMRLLTAITDQISLSVCYNNITASSTVLT